MSHYLSRRAAIFAAAVGALLSASGTVRADVIYDSIPSPLPGNVPSLGYQATSTAEFGDYIAFGPGGRTLTSATVTMSNWAKHSDHQAMDPGGWTHPLTLNLYTVDNSGPTPAVGTLIHSATVNASIPWHDPSNGFNGTAFNVDFALPDVVVPDEIIFGLAYNTQSYGASPIGTAGPYNSLNFGLRTTPVSVGTDVNTGAVFWNTSHAAFYADGGTAGVGTFRQDTDWSPYTPAIRFTAAQVDPEPVPEPASLAVFGLIGGVSALVHRRRKARA